jgi:hypothetical protein
MKLHHPVPRDVFKALVFRLFTIYKERVNPLEPQKEEDNKWLQKIKKSKDIFRLEHGVSKHVFGRTNDNERYYSIGLVLNSILKEKKSTEFSIDAGDFLYKKCVIYNKGEEDKIPVLSEFFTILGYEGPEDFCRGEGMHDRIFETKLADGTALTRQDVLVQNIKGGWYLYFYNNEDYSGRSSVARAILDIEDAHEMQISNRATDISLNFKGGIDGSQRSIQGILYLRFSPVNSNEVRNLQIALHVSPDISMDMALGQYTSVDANSHLIRGSIVIQRIEGYQKGEHRPIRYTEENIDQLDESLRQFFDDRSLNFNRLPSSIYTADRFADWLEDRKHKRRDKNYLYKLQRKKLFISCPINSLDGEHFAEMQQIVKHICRHFEQELGFEEVYAFINGLKGPNDKDKIPSFLEYQEIRSKYEESTYHLIIWPRNIRMSGILFELGWAINAQNPVIIFEQQPGKDEEDKRSQIPQLVLGACEFKRSNILKIPYADREDLIKKIEANGAKIFKDYNHYEPLFAL